MSVFTRAKVEKVEKVGSYSTICGSYMFKIGSHILKSDSQKSNFHLKEINNIAQEIKQN